MSIPAPTVTEQWDQRDGSVGDDGEVTYNRGFIVDFGSITGLSPTEKQTLEHAVALAVGINRWDHHPAEPRATARTATFKPADGPHVWRANYTYSSKPVEAKEADGENPDRPGNENDTPAQLRTPSISVGKRTVQKVLEVDWDGAPVVNSAGDPFDPPIEYEETNLTFTYKFWRLPADLGWTARVAFLDTVNDRPVAIFGKSYATGSLRCTSVIPNMVWDQGTAGALQLFYELTVELEHNRDGWNAHVLDQGRREDYSTPGSSGGEGGTPIPAVTDRRIITDGTGQPVADPVPLDGHGKALPFGSTAYVYLDFVRYPESILMNVLA